MPRHRVFPHVLLLLLVLGPLGPAHADDPPPAETPLVVIFDGSGSMWGDIERSFEIEMADGSTVEHSVDYSTGQLSRGVRSNDELADVTVQVIETTSGKSVAQGRTYTAANTNPRGFTLSPGHYRVRAKAVRLEGKPQREVEIVVEAAGVHPLELDFSP